MAFHFSLQSVLRFRWIAENQAELRLHEANRALQLKKEEIARLDAYVGVRRERWRHEVSGGSFAAELQFEALSEASLQSRREQLVEAAKKLAAGRDQQREVFQKARMDREILESLRDQQLRVQKAEETRRDQRALDEAILMRFRLLRLR